MRARNDCFEALDRRVALGRADDIALTYRAPETDGAATEYSYAELTEQSAKFAGVLRALGVGQADRVAIELPMTPETVVVMLSCIRLGAVYAIGTSESISGTVAARIFAVGPDIMISVPAREFEGDYSSLMRSSAIQPTECVDAPASDPLGLLDTLLTAGMIVI